MTISLSLATEGSRAVVVKRATAGSASNLRREGERLRRAAHPGVVPVLDSGARGATTTFVQKQIGDVHLAWENEAHLEVREAKGELEVITPPISILAEPHVAVVDKNVDRRHTRAAAEAYLKFAYSDEAQEIVAKHFYRPANEAILKKYLGTVFVDLKRFAITDIAKDFPDAHKQLIAEGGVFDTIYKPK